MNRIASILLVVGVASGLYSCTEAGRGGPEPDAVLARKAGVSLDQMGEGYWVFERKCLECHEAKIPRDMTLAQWHPVVEGMAGNAGLSATEEASVVHYLKAATLR